MKGIVKMPTAKRWIALAGIKAAAQNREFRRTRKTGYTRGDRNASASVPEGP